MSKQYSLDELINYIDAIGIETQKAAFALAQKQVNIDLSVQKLIEHGNKLQQIAEQLHRLKDLEK